MKISSDLISNVQIESSSTRTGSAQNSREVAQADVRDKATLSDSAKLVNTLQTRLTSMAETRSTNVQALRDSIASGSYRFFPDQIAAAMQRQVMGA